MAPAKLDDDETNALNSDLLKTLDIPSLEAEISQLASLLESTESGSDSDAEVAGLLAQLESADGMAQGVESKLDGFLETLDNLVASLELDVEVEEGVGEQPLL